MCEEQLPYKSTESCHRSSVGEISVNLKNIFTNMALGGIDSQEVGLYAKIVITMASCCRVQIFLQNKNSTCLHLSFTHT